MTDFGGRHAACNSGPKVVHETCRGHGWRRERQLPRFLQMNPEVRDQASVVGKEAVEEVVANGEFDNLRSIAWMGRVALGRFDGAVEPVGVVFLGCVGDAHTAPASFEDDETCRGRERRTAEQAGGGYGAKRRDGGCVNELASRTNGGHLGAPRQGLRKGRRAHFLYPAGLLRLSRFATPDFECDIVEVRFGAGLTGQSAAFLTRGFSFLFFDV